MQETLNDVMVNIDLRDIHLPMDVPWWPLAAGWWGILIVIVLLLIALHFTRQYFFKRYSLPAVALTELKAMQHTSSNNHEYFKAMYFLLRRIVCLLPGSEKYNRDDGSEWLQWLLQQVDLPKCSVTLGKELTEIPYLSEYEGTIQTKELESLTLSIIQKLPDIRLYDNTSLTHRRQ